MKHELGFFRIQAHMLDIDLGNWIFTWEAVFLKIENYHRGINIVYCTSETWTCFTFLCRLIVLLCQQV